MEASFYFCLKLKSAKIMIDIEQSCKFFDFLNLAKNSIFVG